MARDEEAAGGAARGPGWLEAFVGRLRRGIIDRRSLTWLAGVALALVLLCVRQLRVLVVPRSLRLGESWSERLGFDLYWALVLAFYAAVFLAVSHAAGERTGRAWRSVEAIGRACDRTLARFTPTTALGWMGPALLLALGLVLLGRPDAYLRDTPHASPTLLALHVIHMAFWLWPWSRRLIVFFVVLGHGTSEIQRLGIERLLGRATLLVLLTSLLGEGLWFVTTSVEAMDNGWYSYWAVVHLVFLILLAARCVDGLYLLGVSGIRSRALFAIAVIAIFLRGGEPVGRPEIVAAEAPAPATARPKPGRPGDPAGLAARWFEALRGRLGATGDEGPILLVAASGGGSRAALFASLVYESLARTRVGWGADAEARALTDRILFVSSVSGGSLASAYLLEQARGVAPRRTPKHPRPDSVRRALGRLDDDDGSRTTFPVDPLRSPFVAAMSTDFMAPLLRGVLNLGRERGAAVADFWEDEYGWSRSDNLTATDGRVPLVLFNATSVNRGARVVVPFPAMPPGFLPSPVRTVSDWSPLLRVRTAEAVRVSANFPWGFEIAKLPPEAEAAAAAAAGTDPGGAAAADHLTLSEVIDGGVSDNTGLDTLATLVEELFRRAWREGDPLGDEAALAIEAIVRRGLVVVEIDAGARPDEPSALARQFPTLTRPAHALEQAAHLNALAARMRNLERIEQALRPLATAGAPRRGAAAEGRAPLQLPVAVGVVRAGFRCDPKGDVMTAWALSPSDQARVLRGFRQGEERFLANLEVTFEAVAELQARRRGPGGDPRDAAVLHEFRRFAEEMTGVDALQREAARGCDDLGDEEREEQARRAALAAALVDARRARATPDARGGVAVGAPPAAPPPAAPRPPASASKRAKALPPPVPAPPPPVAAAAPPAAEGLPGEPALPVIPAGSTPSRAPAAARRLKRVGWIYLGTEVGDAGRWTERHFRWPEARGARPAPGTVLEALGKSFVREAQPDAAGEMGRPVGVLVPGARVEVLATVAWGGTGFIWAQVAY